MCKQLVPEFLFLRSFDLPLQDKGIRGNGGIKGNRVSKNKYGLLYSGLFK